MVVVAIDTNKKDLKLLVKFLHMSFPMDEVIMFSDPNAAASYLQENPVDVIYTEVAMNGMTGFGLQDAVEAVQPAVLTVFVTATDAYAGEAIRARVQDYILKPVTRQALAESLYGTKFELMRA